MEFFRLNRPLPPSNCSEILVFSSYAVFLYMAQGGSHTACEISFLLCSRANKNVSAVLFGNRNVRADCAHQGSQSEQGWFDERESQKEGETETEKKGGISQTAGDTVNK